MTEEKEKGHTMIAILSGSNSRSDDSPMQSNRIDAYPQAALKRSSISNCETFSRVTINDNIMIMNNSP